MTSKLKGRVSKIFQNKKGEDNSLSLDGVKAYFNYSGLTYRGRWDDPEVGAIVELTVNAADPAEDGTPRYWVKAIERLDTPEEVPQWMEGVEEAEAAVDQANERKAEALKEVLDTEQDRERRLDRRKALECAAEVVVAGLPFIAVVDGSGHLAATEKQIASLIDTCIERFKLGLDE